MSGPVVPFGRPPGERADAARNRRHLLDVARELLAEQGADRVTMDGLAERACLGKGTVFRRFGSRAGIFRALMDDDEHAFQERILCGPPPLGPGAEPVRRLIAYGRARVEFLVEHQAIARATLERNLAVPAGETSTSGMHIRMLIGQARPDLADPESLAVQLTAALEGPLLLYLSTSDPTEDRATRLADSWQTIVERVFG